MTILEFTDYFPTEQSCRDHFKLKRENEGVVCKKCAGKKQYWLKSKEQWQCANCSFRTGLRSGTVMQSTKLPLRTLYLCMAFMSFTKKGLSANEIRRQIGHKRYQTIWAILHKFRSAMGKRDDRYLLSDMIEFDEGYFETEYPTDAELKQGRGSERQRNVAVMAESTPLEKTNTGKQDKHCRYFKMKVLPTHKKEDVNDQIEESIHEKSIVFSDESTSYVDIENFVEMHITEKSTPTTTKTFLRWVHIAITNAKNSFEGTYQRIKGKYLQNYLDEFCYKLNRRYFGNRIFDRLVLAVASSNW